MTKADRPPAGSPACPPRRSEVLGPSWVASEEDYSCFLGAEKLGKAFWDIAFDTTELGTSGFIWFWVAFWLYVIAY